MPAAEVRPTIVGGVIPVIAVSCVRCGAHEVEATDSCCGNRWKEMELSSGAG